MENVGLLIYGGVVILAVFVGWKCYPIAKTKLVGLWNKIFYG